MVLPSLAPRKEAMRRTYVGLMGEAWRVGEQEATQDWEDLNSDLTVASSLSAAVYQGDP